MRLVVLWLLFFTAVAEIIDVEEEDVGPEDEEFSRRKRDVYDPTKDHARVKRCCEKTTVGNDLPQHNRFSRQVHQYEVHEITDDGPPISPPYEEMLAASADQYHRIYTAPGKTARFLDPHTSSTDQISQVHENPLPGRFSSQPVPVAFNDQPVQFIPIAASPVKVSSLDGLSPPSEGIVAADQDGSATGHHETHGHSQGGGHARHGQHFEEHGGKTSKGFKQENHLDKGGKGYKTDEHHRKEYEEAAGKKKKHHDRADHKGSHEEEAHGHRGSHFGEKKGHKKGHKTKGYHNKYHKDEFHKEHKFYDDYHKSGEHHRYGKFNAKHASNESGKKKAHQVNAGHDFVERGKKGYSNKGHLDADHKGYNGKNGHEEHHEHHSNHGRKGGKEGGSQWGHAKKN
ncbi:hypothetical protein K1T71_004809 [Dendrolimus kikuchii]|uniref:Uncharacterized protein n=1 Tax=Dendrolimus kikuchii TaxID=765133 RepID=A0ACC1D6D8_9NEOP|nr:hypothetical protein K1T71_004809 [Dendrolimus kikuchii]